jgi:hypothetical protein
LSHRNLSQSQYWNIVRSYANSLVWHSTEFFGFISAGCYL